MKTILLLDDEPSILSLFKILLKSTGFKVLTTGQSEDALRILKRRRVDLVIQDFGRLPMNGAEFLYCLKSSRRLSKIPVLMISGSKKHRSLKGFREHGLSFRSDLAGFRSKPCRTERLLRAIKAILEKHKDVEGRS